MSDDVRALLQSRYPEAPERDFPELQVYWDRLTALADQLDPAAAGPTELATTYRATPTSDE